MNKLFDNEEEEAKKIQGNLPNELIPDDSIPDVPVHEEDEEEEHITFRRDKIFNNDFNTGNLNFEEYDLPKVDIFYAEDNLDDCYDSHEYLRKKHLEELIDQYFKESEFNKTISGKKKIPKQIIPLIFVSIKDRFNTNEFSITEIFIAIADYFGANYELFYENIPSIYREQLVRALDEKYGVLRKKGVRRLF